ncbi:MAG TPA: asparaginase [Vicinamibacterales bacterium]|nr:asparaginase [Vicinamibacterales bacterium]
MRARLACLALVLVFGLSSPLPIHAQTGSTVAAPSNVRSQASATVPRVRLVATGGTISNKTGGRLTAEELVGLMPGVERYARPEFEQFTNLASGELTLDQWLGLAKRLNEIFKTEPDVAGLVVTSGTDTLEELAYFLDLTVRSDKPLVIVGSMRNPSTLGYEGAANLLEAFRVAASPDARGKGALVVLNDEINAAREVTKTDALRLNTFQTRGYGVLGVVDADRVVFYRKPVKRGMAQSEFDVSALAHLPRVDVILVYQGADGNLIKAAADAGAQGIVIAGAGAGATSGTQREGEIAAVKKGVVLVTTTRTGSGRIAPRRAPAGGQPRAGNANGPLTPDEQQRFIAGEDLAPVKARVLLMLALTKTHDPVEIQRIFSEY